MHVVTDRASYTDAGLVPIERCTGIRRPVPELASLRRFGLEVRLDESAATSTGSQFDVRSSAPVYVGWLGVASCRRVLSVGLAHPGDRAVCRRDARRPRGGGVSPAVPVVRRAHRGPLG